MAKLLHIFYHKEGTFSLLCQQVQLITVSRNQHTCTISRSRLKTVDGQSLVGFDSKIQGLRFY